jgi:tetratricopeptide (TPR) repeat protein
MFSFKGRHNYRSQIHKANALRLILIFLAAAIIIGVPLFLIAPIQSRKNLERRQLLQAWESGEYNTAYTLSADALSAKPMDYFLLTINGFSAFQLGISQINTTDTLHYIDQCIVALRKAIQLKEAASDGRVFYVLGKAYYYKGVEYADLAVTYLEKALELSFAAPDIPEYLGLSYAASGDFRSSVEAFSLALSPDDSNLSDLLLLSIARSYFELGETETARAYLIRCLEITRDSKSIVTARVLLAEIYSNAGNSEEAEKQYLAVLEADGDNAEAYYQLGELYAGRGDMTQARAQWRLSLRADPGFQKARARFSQSTPPP